MSPLVDRDRAIDIIRQTLTADRSLVWSESGEDKGLAANIAVALLSAPDRSPYGLDAAEGYITKTYLQRVPFPEHVKRVLRVDLVGNPSAANPVLIEFIKFNFHQSRDKRQLLQNLQTYGDFEIPTGEISDQQLATIAGDAARLFCVAAWKLSEAK